ncbi:MAG: protoporphyrinogen oxidase, partial [Nitrososphaeria archaeon]
MYDVLIIGGGVSGLTLAYELKKLSKSVCLIEGERLGGKIATAELEGKIVEEGPEEVVNSKSFMQLLSELGLLEEMVRPKKSRFAVLRNGKLYTVPEGIAGGILRLNSDLFRSAFSGLFSLSTLMRMLLEPLYNVSVEDDMSVKDLFTAVYGKQFVEDFFRPLAGGIYGGDIGLMSSSVYFPYILDIKKKGESVVRSFMKKKIGFDLVSFKLGLGSLIPRLQEKIKGVDVMIGEMAREVRYEKDFISVRAGAEELRGSAAALM